MTTPDSHNTLPLQTLTPCSQPKQAVINFAKFIHFDKHLADDSRSQLTAFAYVFAAFMAMSERSADTQHGHIHIKIRMWVTSYGSRVAF